MNTRCLLITSLALAAAQPAAAVLITNFNTAVSENFDTLATTTSSLVPAGWSFVETGTGANATYGAGTGSSATGNTYSFGSAGSTERAFGTLRTGGVVSTIGTIVVNDTGGSIAELLIAYTGEQWRLGTTGRIDRLDFAYSLDATSLATGTWHDVDALDFATPTTTGATGAMNGNVSPNHTPLSFAITGLAIANDAALWLRWSDVDAAGADDGLAIDNFVITAVQTVVKPAPMPESLPLGTLAGVLAGMLLLATQLGRLGPRSIVSDVGS